MRSISMSRMLAVFAAQQNCVFTVNGALEEGALVMAPELFLPAITQHADASARSLLGMPLGVTYQTDPESLLGVRAEVPDVTGDEISVVRAAFFTAAAVRIFGIAPHARVECAPVFAAYQNGLLSHLEQTGPLKWPMAAVLQR